MRRRYLYSGQVEGVGFRETARRLAGGFAVAGFVRNLPDGRVEMVAEGEAPVLETFVGEVERAMEGLIRGVEREAAGGGEPYSGFVVRR